MSVLEFRLCEDQGLLRDPVEVEDDPRSPVMRIDDYFDLCLEDDQGEELVRVVVAPCLTEGEAKALASMVQVAYLAGRNAVFPEGS